jgi:hypothetical protein
MLIYAVGLFALAAIFGVYLASRVFQNRLPPWPAAALHGVLAATALLILLYAALLAGDGPAPTLLLVACAIFVVAALGGFVMLSFHVRGQVPPKPLAAVHGLAAVAGFLLLCGSVFELI